MVFENFQRGLSECLVSAKDLVGWKVNDHPKGRRYAFGIYRPWNDNERRTDKDNPIFPTNYARKDN